MPFSRKTALLLILFTGLFQVVKSQELRYKIDLEWQKPARISPEEDISIKTLNFKGASFTGSEKPQAFWAYSYDLPSSVNSITVRTENEVWEEVPTDQLVLLDESQVPEIFAVNAEVAYARFQPRAVLSFFPYRKDLFSGKWMRLMEVDLLIGGTIGSPLQQRGQRTFAASSVLANDGEWFRVGVIYDGVYKISYEFLKGLGVIAPAISSSEVHLFGNSAGMLAEANAISKPDDLLQNAINMVDGGDGVFGPGDYFLFYAKGPHKVNYNASGQLFTQQVHLYCDTSYYFINVGSTSITQKLVSQQTSSSSPATHIVNTFDDFMYLEQDKINFIKSGREWYGDLFDFTTEYTYNFAFPNIDVSQSVRVKTDLAARTPGSGASNFLITSPGTTGNVTVVIPGVGTGAYTAAANPGNGIMTFMPSSSNVSVKVKFNKATSTSQGWLNYIQVQARRNLIHFGDQMHFRDKNSVGAGNVAEFVLSGVSGSMQLWDVTEPDNASQLNVSVVSGQIVFRANADIMHEYIAFRSNSCPTPFAFGKVSEQNLHSLSPRDLIIITHPQFYSQAAELAAFHESEGTGTILVTTDQVYNEFSSGMKDATAIKQFLRMFYERAAGDPALLPKYVLLFGDGSYDNKNRVGGNTSYIPTYQSFESTMVTVSFVSDDYFVHLDPTENMNNSDQLDMAVGRIPCRNQVEAQGVVNKIKLYSQNTGTTSLESASACDLTGTEFSMGDWRNWYGFVADDEDFNSYIDAAEQFADSLKVWYPFLNVDKVFLDAYLQQSTPGGQRYPEVNEAIRSRVEKGALVLNYIGHGGEVGWAHERILDLATVNGWTNNPRLPLFMTATCEFSRFDDPGRVSAGEYVLLNASGGGIGLLTTTRLVYSGPNEILNRNFNKVVLVRDNGVPRTLGDIFMQTKNLTISQISTSNTRNFTLLGDPAVRLKQPYNKVVADSVNHVAIGSGTDTLKALTRITISGHMEDQNGNFLSGYNGIVFPTVFDKEQILYSLGNDPGSSVRQFDLRKNVIYRGKASVVNGRFEFTFVVPKDIAYQFGIGKISFYAHNGIDDATGVDLSIIVGSTNPNAPVDNDGPIVRLFMNDENFVSGGTTDETPVLLARLQDENGVNTVGTGIGHDITAILDGNTSSPVILNEYYESDANTYQSGVVSYPFRTLSEGPHNLRFKVWDVYNNSTDASVDFVVARSAEMSLKHVLNYPNPFTTRTQFFFEHNQCCTMLDVQVQVFTVAGKLVKTLTKSVFAEGYRSDPIEWDGRDDYGDKIGIGTYIYRIRVRTPDGKMVEKFEKLVILN
ncbi:MAG: type IX secretion system sortase PorU [Flavobacteriales bacterium]